MTISARLTRASAVPNVFAWSAECDQLIEPEIVTGEVVVWRVVRVSPQIPEVLQEHKRRILLFVEGASCINNSTNCAGPFLF